MRVVKGTSSSKAILSGEHSIAAGQPAIVVPIPLYTECDIQLDERGSPQFFINLENFKQKKSINWLEFEAFGAQKHEQWRTTQRSVLENPFDLVLLTLWQFHQLVPLPGGRYDITLKGHDYIGRGLGSSAAVVVSLIRALQQLVDMPLGEDALLALATRCEHYAHGRSSGLDPAALLAETPLWVERTATGPRFEPLAFALPTFQLLDTGAPESRTGECVISVKQQFPSSHPIWPAFGETTRAMRTALENQDTPALAEAIQTNHILLRKIGVVPDAVNDLIRQLNQTGAAKISGAGSVRGDNGGIVLYFGPPLPNTHSIITHD